MQKTVKQFRFAKDQISKEVQFYSYQLFSPSKFNLKKGRRRKWKHLTKNITSLLSIPYDFNIVLLFKG